MDYDDIEASTTGFEQIHDLLSTSSDEDERMKPGRGGSIPGKHANLNRNFSQAAALLHSQYFDDVPLYNSEIFRRRYRISKHIYGKVFNAVISDDKYFKQKRDGCGRMGICPHVKITAALRILAYGVPPDAVDENLALSESTARECVKRFCKSVIRQFSGIYLREPTEDDVKEILKDSASRGVPGLLGSIDCCKWQ